jgi:glycosyltransferase involved in cell wall biosynthesis
MDLTGQRIVIAHPSADLYGSDRMMLETVEGLVATGAEVIVAVPSGGPLLDHIRAKGALPVVVESLVLRSSLVSLRGAFSILAQSVRSVGAISAFLARYRPATVYVSTVSIPWWPVLARLAGRRVLVHIHEAEGHVRPAIRHLLVLPLLFSSGVIANSRYTIRVLGQSLPKKAARARLVYNGVAGPSSVTPPRGQLTDPVRLVYFGRISHRKGVDVAVDAVAELARRGRKVRLDVVGAVFGGNEDYAQGLAETIRREGLSDSVHLQGFKESIWASVDESDIVLVPARLDESFGNTVVEAMLAARPAVVSAMPGLLEAGAGFGSVRFVQPDDAGELASAVESIIDDWPLWRGHAVEDRERALEHHAPGRYREEVVASITGTGKPGQRQGSVPS